ncbi:Glutathione S-transferase 2 [Rhizina undulata]
MSSYPDVTLYTTQTPNGVKISIALEELGLPYKVEKLDISTNVQKQDWFLAINPNGRIPAIVDRSFADGKELPVFESGAILQYLTETYDKEHKISYPHGTREYWEVQQWLFFQNAGVGPMQGQANHFFRYAPEKIPYGINRYITETKRLYSVLEKHLEKSTSGYLVGDRLTIADIAHYGWVYNAGWSGIDINEFPKLKAWEERLGERVGVQKGRDVPNKSNIKELLADRAAAEAAEEAAKKWILSGQTKD